MRLSNLLDKEFKVMVIQWLTKNCMKMNTLIISTKREKTKKYQIEVTELKNTVCKLKNTPEGFKQTR